MKLEEQGLMCGRCVVFQADALLKREGVARSARDFG